MWEAFLCGLAYSQLGLIPKPSTNNALSGPTNHRVSMGMRLLSVCSALLGT